MVGSRVNESEIAPIAIRNLIAIGFLIALLGEA
jgi:hypothetical protein